MTIGFSNGVFHKLFKGDNSKRLSEEYLKLFKRENAIELNCTDKQVIDKLFEINRENYSKFNFISLHVPTIGKINSSFLETMPKIQELARIFNVKNIIFHAGEIERWDIFNYKELPISVENMDSSSSFGKTVEDIEKIIKKYNIKLTLDLNHCFTNDESMKLAEEFHKRFKDKIVEYHISGFKDKKDKHYPLFKTRQDIIIDSLKTNKIPIIIESGFEKTGEEKKEMDYIMKELE